MPRVTAIGFDAAEWDVLTGLMDEGELPNFSAIRARSAECRLENVVAYRAELAWTQFVTGKDGWGNGYWSTAVFDPGTYEASCIGAHHGRPFYALGEERKVIAFDLPHSVIADDVAGAQITAWGAHAPQYPRAARPAGLLRRIDDTFGPHPAFEVDSDLGWNDPAYVESLADALAVGARRRLEIAAWLQEQVPDWDLLLTTASETHSGGHHLFHGLDPTHPLRDTPTAALAGRKLRAILNTLDAAVGEFVSQQASDTIVVLYSVHGMHASDDLPSLVLVPEILHRLQFGTPMMRDRNQRAWRRAGCPPVMPRYYQPWAIMGELRERMIDPPWPRSRWRHLIGRIVPPEAYRAARRLAGKPPLLPLGARLEEIPPETDLTPEEIRARGCDEPLDWQPAMWYQRFWPQMRAFTLPSFSGDAHIRINVRGRERDGIVDPEDYERACEEVIDVVRRCTDPRTGQSALGGVVRLRADDPMAPDGPDADLAIQFSGPFDALEHPDAGMVGPLPYMRAGTHTSNGFALFSGPGIERRDLGTHSAFDLPPTILEMLGNTPPDDLAGKSLLSHLGLPEPSRR